MNLILYLRKIVDRIIVLGLIILIITITFFFHPTHMGLNPKGPLMRGHTNMSCAVCHADETGSLLDQAAAQIRYYAGVSDKFLYIGSVPVSNKQCLSCHQREDDRHPVERFLETRFIEARKSIKPQFCTSCHREHNDGKLLALESGYCVNCHRDTKVKNDPIKPAHAELFKKNRWTTCLQCHDFHGNHRHKVATVLEDAHLLEEVLLYLNGKQRNPYSEDYRWPALTETQLKNKNKQE